MHVADDINYKIALRSEEKCAAVLWLDECNTFINPLRLGSLQFFILAAASCSI